MHKMIMLLVWLVRKVFFRMASGYGVYVRYLKSNRAMLHARYNIAFLCLSEWSYRDSEVVMESLSSGEQSEMLHSEDDYAFRWACGRGHQEIAKWLWAICPDLEQPAMLHANDDSAFRLACGYGHLETANWLWSICPELEQSVMLHARYDYAFRLACEKGHLAIAEWLWGLCKTAKDRSAMLHAKDDRAFREACIWSFRDN